MDRPIPHWICVARMPLAALSLIVPATALAHPGHGLQTGLSLGFLHPLTGVDHLLAMLAVGIWAAQLGGRALWLVPATFVAVMALGGVLGFDGLTVPYFEQGIAASVLVLGLMIACGQRLPLPISVALVASFALFHGYAHGAELPADTAGLTFGIGFMLSTTLLHGVGLLIGLGAQKLYRPIFSRGLGGAIALGGVALLTF